MVEDAAQSGAYRGRKIGALSAATCFSLYATKNVAAGEGGVITTDDAGLASAIDDLRVMRRGQGSLYDIAVPGYKATCPTFSRRSRSASWTRSNSTGRSAPGMSTRMTLR